MTGNRALANINGVTPNEAQADTNMEQGEHVILEGNPASAVLIVCDHASCFIPAEFGDLGVVAEHLRDHIAWDIGAGPLARALAKELGVTALLAGVSRLVVDCNRHLDDPTAFPETSDGVSVPGNSGLTTSDRQHRADTYYWPYHHAIRDRLCKLESIFAAPAVISIHSFTPELEGVMRPWHIGALWDKDNRISAPFMKYFGHEKGIMVGDNEPYSGRHKADFTLDHHAEAEGLPHVGIEIRQDLVTVPGGVDEWAGILAGALRVILADSTLYTHRAGQQ
ncbi:MAG: N-formylglutamate amidohydrolase [Gammaproteobacteria bacterium]|nr:N-formylglutamate amidohydrolase [Gammaproteobacteria bacterium]